MVQKATRSLMLTSGTPVEALTRERRLSNPPAFAEVFRVYWAVLESDSRMRLAIFSRRTEILEGGSARSAERITPSAHEPSGPVPMCVFAEASCGEE